MELTKIPEEQEQEVASLEQIYAELVAPFPDEALSRDDSRGFALTSLKAQYAVERLNQVFTPFGWSIGGDFIFDNQDERTGGVTHMGMFKYNLAHRGHDVQGTLQAIGYSKEKKNKGDTLKSAQTDALCKVASKFGVGNEIFKGNVEPPNKGGAKTTKKPETFAGKASANNRYRR